MQGKCHQFLSKYADKIHGLQEWRHDELRFI